MKLSYNIIYFLKILITGIRLGKHKLHTSQVSYLFFVVMSVCFHSMYETSQVFYGLEIKMV